MIVTWQGREINFTPPWRRIPLRQAILEASDIDYEAFPTAEELRAEMRRNGIDASSDAQWGKLVDTLLSKFVEPNLIQPTFLIDYPKDVSPLAKSAADNPLQVERFEGFVGGFELCNAFSEINDPQDQLQRFIDENYRATHGDDEAHPIDVDYIEALSYGMPPTGGFGMGIDRLTMLFTDRDTLREVILFPHLREIRHEEEIETEKE
jgi:lysyl-tRNA synthetase class 2